MLNPFPELLDYSLFAPLVLRVVLGFIIFNLGWVKIRGERRIWLTAFEAMRLRPAFFWVTVVGIAEMAGGAMFIVGLFIQMAALVFVCLTLIESVIEYRAPYLLKRGLAFYMLLFVISLSLLVSGAGLFAIDLPL